MVPIWFHPGNHGDPDSQEHSRRPARPLKDSAERNRRSLNSEILIRLESAFTAPVVDVHEHARDLKAFTDAQPMIDHARVDRYKRHGRT